MKTKVSLMFGEFFRSEQASGVVMLASALIALAVANSPWSQEYLNIWQTKAGVEFGDFQLKLTLQHWINDGLMAVFFLVIGLEIERELYVGELKDFKSALLPIVAAVGGMLVPALLYFLLTRGTEAQVGFGIPMATDIAFALGAISLIGNKVPLSLKVFLTALAIIDDIGAILVIAVFYAEGFSLLYFGLAIGTFVGLVALNRIGKRSLALFVVPGILMWYFLMQSGIHGSLAGILLAFAIPFGKGDESSLSYRLQHALHKPVAFVIMPLFALANTGVHLLGATVQTLLTPNTLGIFAGLFIGKPLGVVLFSLAAIRMRLSKLPAGLYFKHLLGAGFIAGIGFTMSIFITLLAFGNSNLGQTSKIAIMVASILSAMAGLVVLSYQRRVKGV